MQAVVTCKRVHVLNPMAVLQVWEENYTKMVRTVRKRCFRSLRLPWVLKRSGNSSALLGRQSLVHVCSMIGMKL
jgi:hypothetical protein